MTDPTGRDFFEALHLDEDPWNFASDGYELARYERLLAFVPPGRYSNVLEPGCSVGVLTDRLADRCDQVTAVDISSNALMSARRRCAHHDNVRFARGSITEVTLDRNFDLVVLSEVGYYFDTPELAWLVRRLVGSIGTRRNPHGARVIAAHWLGHSSDHLLHGSQVHQVLADVLGPPAQTETHRCAANGFVLDVWDFGPDGPTIPESVPPYEENPS